MSILFVHERASFAGGVEQNIADTVKAFTRRNIPCHLSFNPHLPTEAEFLGLFASAHPCTELSAAQTLTPTVSLGEIAVRLQVDSLYFHKVPVIPASVMSLLARKIQMVHDHDLYCPRRHKYFAYDSKICSKPMGIHCYLDAAFLLRDKSSLTGFRLESIASKRKELLRRQRFDLSIVGSTFMREQLLMNGFAAERIHTIPLAVRDAPATTGAIPSGTPTILFVGQLIRGKGVDQLLYALAKLHAPYRAIIVGQGNAERALKQLSRDLGLDYLVNFVGWVKNQDMERYYAQADILAVPSRWPEPFGMVGLEAMRHSKPVVAFNVGGIPDWLLHERTGLLVPPGDIQAFANALQRLLTDRENACRYGVEAARSIRRSFNFETYIDRLQAAVMPTLSPAP